MPLHFWNDAGGSRHHDAYFPAYPGVRRHGRLPANSPRRERRCRECPPRGEAHSEDPGQACSAVRSIRARIRAGQHHPPRHEAASRTGRQTPPLLTDIASTYYRGVLAAQREQARWTREAGKTHRAAEQTRQALADLALAGPREAGAAKVAALRLPRLVPEAAGSLPVGENGALAGVALSAGAQLVRTSSVRAVAEAVGQAMATQGAVCLFGDPGRGKTAAVRMALSEGPPGWKVTWVPVPCARRWPA